MRTYLDCHWITTQVLHKHALNVPEDTDLIIGYMFQVRSSNNPIPPWLQIYNFVFAFKYGAASWNSTAVEKALQYTAIENEYGNYSGLQKRINKALFMY